MSDYVHKVYSREVGKTKETIDLLFKKKLEAEIWSSLWKQAAKHYRKLFYEEFNSGHYMKLQWSKTHADADRRLELLRRMDRDLGFCIICRSNELDWAGNKVHKDDCELAKELKND